jgi:PAS domain S-box-containing protein
MTTVLYVSEDEGRRRAASATLRGRSEALSVGDSTPADLPDRLDGVDCVVVDVDATALSAADVRALGYEGPLIAHGDGPYEELVRYASEGFSDVVRGADDPTERNSPAGGPAPATVDRLLDRIQRYVAADGAKTTRATRGREEVLTHLHETNRELIRAGDPAEVGEITVRTAEEALGLEVAVFGAYDTERRRIVPLALSDSTRASFPEVATRSYGPDTELYRTFRGGETRLFDDATDGLGTTGGLGPAIAVPLGRHGVLLVGSVDADRGELPSKTLHLATLLAANAETALDRAVRETSLREERDRIAALFQNTSDAIAEVEYVDGEPIVRSVNPAFEAVFGHDERSVRGRNVDDVIVPADVRDDAEEFNRKARGGERIEREVRRTTAHGVRDFLLRVVPLDLGGRPNNGYAIYTDITERKRHERTLNSLHETTRKLMRAETTGEVAATAIDDIEDLLGYPINGVRLYDETKDALVLVAVSDRTFDVLGERPDYGRGDGIVWETFVSGETAVFDSAEAVDDDNDRPGLGGVMYVPIGHHGVLTFGLLAPETFDDSDVRLTHLLAANVEAALDRAERTQLLRSREAELERQNGRLEEFASVVSHDLRNPLSVARGYLGLASDACDSPEADEHFERVERAHERMTRLISDLLSLARQGQAVGETEPTPVSALARRSWSVIDTANATLVVEDPPTVDADPERLTTLFENLFRNAVTHGGAGVTVRVGPLDEGRGFFVEDDGPGVPEAERETVFQRGVSRGDGGTGFGLSIVRGIVDAHDWNVALTEAEGGGARFEIRTG